MEHTREEFGVRRVRDVSREKLEKAFEKFMQFYVRESERRQNLVMKLYELGYKLCKDCDE